MAVQVSAIKMEKYPQYCSSVVKSAILSSTGEVFPFLEQVLTSI